MDNKELNRLLDRGAGICREAARLPVPRVHGNGFVQLDTKPDGSERLHIWGHPLIPQQSVRTGIHDHTYTVHSEVLVGSIIDISWATEECHWDESTHQIFRAQPRDGQDTELVGEQTYVQVAVQDVHYIGEHGPRSKYTVLPCDFHSSVTTGVAATLMRKGLTSFPDTKPRILVPTGMIPDNSFDRNAHPAALLWGIIDEVVPSWRDLL